MKKYLKILPVFLGLVISLTVIRRELWFDEALTLLNFVLPMDLGRIYNSYYIPNNQIVYSMMLKIWCKFYPRLFDEIAFWRMLSMCCAAGMLTILMWIRHKLDKTSIFPAALVLSAMTVSAVFANYSTALRGYAASWLFAASALLGLYLIFHGRKLAGWVVYIVSCLLAVGTVPTNLLTLTAAAVYALPWMKEEFYKDKRFYGVFAAIPASLILFYAPIARRFLATFRLGEGFSSRIGAAGVTLGMYAACFGLLLILGAASLKKQTWQYRLRYLIWLMPFAAIFILHRAPFPRVFVTMLPVLAMLVIDGMNGFFEKKRSKGQCAAVVCCVMAVQLLLIPGGAWAAEKLQLSKYQDDFFQPWYMLPGYSIRDSVEELRKHPEYQFVFLSFDADPCPFRLYASIAEIPNFMIYDIPYHSVKNLPEGTVLILRNDEDAAAYEKRFNGRLNKLSENGQHTFYQLY